MFLKIYNLKLNICFINDVHGYIAPHPELFYNITGEVVEDAGGYVKRCFGLQVNFRIENPKGHRIQEIYFKGVHIDIEKTYKVGFVTTQGVASKYGKNRKNHDKNAVEAMKDYLKINPKFTPSKISSYRLV